MDDFYQTDIYNNGGLKTLRKVNKMFVKDWQNVKLK